MGGEGWPLTPCWPGPSWPARSPTPGLAGQGVTMAKGGACHCLGHPPAPRPFCWHHRPAPPLPSRPSPLASLAPTPIPLPLEASLAQWPALLSLPASPTLSKPTTHPGSPDSLGSACSPGDAIYIWALIYPISPGPARKNPLWPWPLRTASSPPRNRGAVGSPHRAELRPSGPTPRPEAGRPPSQERARRRH